MYISTARVAGAERTHGIPASPGGIGPIRGGEVAWRFLLPKPNEGVYEHALVLGGPRTMGADLIASGIVRRADGVLPASPVADLVIRLHDSPVAIDTAARALKPGGVLYAEFSARRGLGLAARLRTRQTLRSAGLTETGLWWCNPDFGRPQAYVPLDAGNATRWFARNAFQQRSAGDSVRRIVLRWAPAFVPDLATGFVNTFAVTAIAGGVAGFAMPLSWRGVPDRLRSAETRVLVLASRNERTIILAFAPGRDHPDVAIKVSNSSAFNGYTEREQQVLATVRSMVGEPLLGTIPQPFGCSYWNGLAVGVDEGADGRLLASTTPRWRSGARRAAEFRQVADWLTAFHAQTAGPRRSWGELAREQPPASLFGSFTSIFGRSPESTALFAYAGRLSSRLAHREIALVWSQGDFHPGNVYIRGDSVKVVDWAGAGQTLPLMDLLKFADQLNNRLRKSWTGPARRRSFELLFIEPGGSEMAAQLRGIMSRYTATLGIDRAFIPLLLVLTWVDLAVYHGALARSGGPTAHRRYADVFASYVELLASTARDDFLPLDAWASGDSGDR
jgi:hypothetical protein